MPSDRAITVKLSDVVVAVDFVSFGEALDNAVVLHTATGQLLYAGDAIDSDEFPDDAYDNPIYIEIPSARDLDLGQRLVFTFTAQSLPERLEHVHHMFSRRGAYSRFKDLLTANGLIEQWYRFEEEALKSAVIEWCRANAINVQLDT
ncbi:UPF0158 family protein [Aliagarivorans taiwanensis]|uniref:UPF0158 family protein n=1 Tax=Aliagarivorans taiwanensis TaxID=561966 RepID=UPI00047D4289|nr:UPF0158 family protein [Aliagarivorans taiwanensis]